MSKGMLGTLPLRVVRGPRDSLEENLAGEEGSIWLKELKRFLRKESCWTDGKHSVIDCSADLADLFFEELGTPCVHDNLGDFEWDLSRLVLYQHPSQKGEMSEEDKFWRYDSPWRHGPVLYRFLRRFSRTRANACILEYLLKYQGLIPREWRGKKICFWGTLINDEGRVHPGDPFAHCVSRVLYMEYHEKKRRWIWGHQQLQEGIDDTYYALLIED